MRHHRKSNNGVFSKKQKKASRLLMKARSGFSPSNSSSSFDLSIPSGGLLSGILSFLFARKVGRQRV